MKYIMHRFVMFAFAGLASLSSLAQKKDLTDEQYFKGNFKGITQSLPSVTRWIDDNRVIIIREGKSFVLETASGKERN